MTPSNIYNTKTWTDKFMYTKPVDSFDKERVNKILCIIPEDVKTVLDVGTGGGYIYRRLKDDKGLKCFSIDISFNMLKKLNDNKSCLADVKNIPFKNEEFDLVLACDLIEHIEKEFFSDSISELKRIAKKYILVNSPFKDAINWPVSLCNKCNKEFNIYGHLRTVDMKLIKALFPADNFVILKTEIFGRKRTPRPYFLVYIARKYGKDYSREGVICPYCFNRSIGYPHRTFFEKFIGRTIWTVFLLIDRLIPSVSKKGSEICILLQKKK